MTKCVPPEKHPIMKRLFTHFFFAVLAFAPGISFAQIGNTIVVAIDDTICVMPGQAITDNVVANDSF